MKDVQEFLKGKKLSNTEYIEDFLELSDYTRELFNANEYEKINVLIRKILSIKYFEAFSWVISILQEKYSSKSNDIEDLSFDLGRKIDEYNKFTNVLGLKSEPDITSIKPISGQDGDIESFYNILIFKTTYNGLYLVSIENFDTRDNDFIQYKLLFTKSINKYIKKIENSDEV